MSPEPRFIGDYEILCELHSGGMGSVHLARKRSVHGFEKLVAIKTIRSELRGRKDMRDMFLTEARLVARLRHPSIAQVHDFGEIDGDAYLVMEYVEGACFVDLLDLLGGPLPIAPACRMMSEVCRGLHAAHEMKDFSGAPLMVVHRDVSPQNLMLTFDGRVKILDFGIARTQLRQTPVTAIGSVKGKPGYMAPEQIVSGAEIDRRTDVFLAGIVLHELLTGQRLFDADSLVGLAHLLMNEPIEPPSRRQPSVTSALDALVLRSLSRERDGRFATALEMAEALDAVVTRLDGESSEAFAARVLAERRKEHEERLRRLIMGGGVPAGELTGDARPPRGATRTSVTLTAARASTPVPDAPSSDADGDHPAPGPRRWRYLAAAAIVFVGTGAVAWLGARPAPRAVEPGAPSAAAERATVSAPAPAAAVPTPSPVAEPLPRSPTERKMAARPRPGKVQHDRAAPKAVTTATPSLGSAKLTVGAEPYALVRINGTEVGTTPIFELSVEAGVVEVELLSPDTRAVRLQRRLVLVGGEHQQIRIP